MVAQLKTHFKRKAFIYLTVLALIGCSEDQYTVVELHHKQPSELKPVIDQQLGEDIKYDITGQTIVFYDASDSLHSTIRLLEALDKESDVYSLEFSWKNPNRISTTKLPPSISIQSSKNNVISLFKTNWHINIQPSNQSQVWLSLKVKNKRKVIGEQHYLIALNQAQELEHSLLPEGLMVTVKSY